ncbi:hypothetical protein EJ06DRAFT_541154 [Trichodelitschia bisporula]|uniref:Uncharacterized protein n=1 Tax=Trichodelitschia bisporula TaxID=703511 RepID=A0A6G1I9H0_9PEZI|nr:hypothetical protein EJ06DRAFT_541154 [Trichodelitschia bisporula]
MDRCLRLSKNLFRRTWTISQLQPSKYITKTANLHSPHAPPHSPTTSSKMDLETFEQLPLTLDPQTKAISSAHLSPDLARELQTLNQLHRTLLTVDGPHGVPPPPIPVNPKRSANISKLRETGNTHYRKAAYADAIRMYSLGIDMALGRPAWEPAGLVREELSALYANRAQAHMAGQNWPEGAVDAQCSVELKKVQNSKAWWRRGKCLIEMGRLEEAREWLAEAVEFEGSEGDLVELLGEVEKRLVRQ